MANEFTFVAEGGELFWARLSKSEFFADSAAASFNSSACSLAKLVAFLESLLEAGEVRPGFTELFFIEASFFKGLPPCWCTPPP